MSFGTCHAASHSIIMQVAHLLSQVMHLALERLNVLRSRYGLSALVVPPPAQSAGRTSEHDYCAQHSMILDTGCTESPNSREPTA